MKYLLISLITLSFLSSCSRHEEVIDTTLQPGHILCSNGEIVHPDLFNDHHDAVGIVFWCNDGSNPKIKDLGYAVSLHDIGYEFLMAYNIDVSGVSEDEDAFDGAANTIAFLAYATKDTIAVPAIDLAINYTPSGMRGWFIPSVAQNNAIYANLSKVYHSLDLVQGDHFSGWYWSSTEDGTGNDTPKVYAIASSIEEGRNTASSKNLENKVRPIIAIR